MLKNSKWRSRVIILEDDEYYSDPLEVTEKASISRILSEKNQIFMIWVERDSALRY